MQLSLPHAEIALVDVPPLIPAGVGRLVLYVDRHPVGDLDMQTCPTCRIGIIHHIRIDPTHRRRGLARLAVTTILNRHPNHTWTTTTITETPAAQTFWAAIDLPQTSPPATCGHMRDADERTP